MFDGLHMKIWPPVHINHCCAIFTTKMCILYALFLFLCNFASKLTILIIDSLYSALNINITKHSSFPPPLASSSAPGLLIYVQMCVHSGRVVGDLSTSGDCRDCSFHVMKGQVSNCAHTCLCGGRPC